MSFGPQLLIFASIVLVCTLATVVYARQRMDIRVMELRNNLEEEMHVLIKSVGDLSQNLSSLSVGLAQQQGQSNEVHNKLSELSESITTRIETITQRLVTLDSSNISVEAELSRLSENLGQYFEQLGATKTQLTDLSNDLELQLSVDRIADVEQLAITAAHMAGDSLAEFGVKVPKTVSRQIHGHALLMYQILLDESSNTAMGPRGGFHVLEIGTTREKWWPQMSTSRLAALCRTLGYKMLTVDVDELNTLSGGETSRFYGATVEAKTAPGEVFIAEWEGELPPYIYIDAYDYDHDMHTEERQERYRKLQGAEISDEACWEMHLQCAVVFAEKCPEGGVVVFDDVFYKDGNWLGKGKLAVPFLLEAGFELTSQTEKTAVFRKP